MTRTLSLTAVYEPVEEGWIQASIEELPGVITAAPSLEEAKEMLLDALHEYLLALGMGVEPSPPAEGASRDTLEISLTA